MNREHLYNLSTAEFKELAKEIRREDRTFRQGGDVRKSVMEWYLGPLEPKVVIIYETAQGTYFQSGKMTQYHDKSINYTCEHKNQKIKQDDKKLREIQTAMVNNNDCIVYLAQRNSKCDLFKVRRVDSLVERDGEWSINCSEHIDNAPCAECDQREPSKKSDNTGKYKRGVAFMAGLNEVETDFHLKFSKGGSPFLSYKIWY